MKLSATIESTVVIVVGGKPAERVFAPDIVASLHDRYRFVDRPTTAAEYASEVSLLHGFFNGGIINKITIYNDGILATTQNDTDFCDNFLSDVESLFNDEFGIDVCENIVNKFYNSKIECELAPGINEAFSRFDAARALLDDFSRGHGVHAHPYRVASLGFYAEAMGPITP